MAHVKVDQSTLRSTNKRRSTRLIFAILLFRGVSSGEAAFESLAYRCAKSREREIRRTYLAVTGQLRRIEFVRATNTAQTWTREGVPKGYT